MGLLLVCGQNFQCAIWCDATVGIVVDHHNGCQTAGTETPYGLELLATVHWIIANDRLHDPDEVADATWAWSHRKRRFTRDQIDLALDRLNALGWVDAPTAS